MNKLVLKKSHSTPSGKHYRINYAAELNEQQLAAVMHTTGPALILAGAGTGKTRTLVYRVARLVEDGVDPASILLLTFTRKAARQMLHRAGALLDGRCDNVAGGTFHSFAYACLQRFKNSEQHAVSILDQADSEDVMNLVRSRFNVQKLKRRFPNKATLVRMASTSINTMTKLDSVIQQNYGQFIEETDKIAEVVRAYQLYKRDNSLFDYDDLLLNLLSLTNNDEYGSVLRKQFRHIMVDEYQDTNILQHNIVKGLSGDNGNVVAVGDDAQSIYGFRGAEVGNIHAFPKSFSSCNIITLEHNYRSTQPVLDLCNKILSKSTTMFKKELFTDTTEGDAPIVVACSNERQQSSFIVQQVLQSVEEGTPLSEIAVLFRSGFLSFDLEIELAKANIPFRKTGGMRFTEAAHVKDLLAFLRVSVNPRDIVSWYRLLLLHKGIGQTFAQRILDEIQQGHDVLATDGDASSLATKLPGLVEHLSSINKIFSAQERASTVADYYKPILERSYDDHQKRWKDIETVVAICGQYSATEDFLSDILLDPPTDALADIAPDDGESEFLSLSTIHSAKGLEWTRVYVIWANEGRIPSAKSAESEKQLEEERRLLYVACTRAKQYLILSYPMLMFEWEHSDVLGQPSRFLDGMADSVLQKFWLEEESSDT